MDTLADNGFGSLIHRDRVHRSVYTDSKIFDLEMERIFERAWVYVGHESEVRSRATL